LAGRGQAGVERAGASGLRDPGTALADLRDRAATASTCVLFAAALEVQIAAAERRVTGASDRRRPRAAGATRLRAGCARAASLTRAGGVAFAAFAARAAGGSTRASLGGLKGALVVTGLDLVVETLQITLGALAALLGAGQASRGVTAAGRDYGPAAAVRRALFDAGPSATFVTRVARDTAALETARARLHARGLIDPLAGITAQLRPAHAAAAARLARRAFATHTERTARARLALVPRSLCAANLRLIRRARIASPVVWHACPRASAVAAQEIASLVVHEHTADALL